MAKRWPCTGDMANHDTVLGARNGVGISGPSLGLTNAGLDSEPHSMGIGISLKYLAIFCMTLHAKWRRLFPFSMIL